MMRIVNKKNIKIYFLVCLLSSIISCKKSIKEVYSGVFENSAQKVLKEAVTEEGISSIKKMNLKDFTKFIEPININLHKSFTSLDKSFQNSIKNAFDEDISFRKVFLNNKNLIQEYQLFTKNLPKLQNNISFLKWYAKSIKKSDNLFQPSLFKRVSLRENNGIINFIGENNNILARYRGNNVVELTNITNDNKILDNPLLNEELLPNSIYKVKGKMGVSVLWEVDHLGRVKRIDGSFTSPENMMEILHKNTSVKLDPSWNIEFQKLKQSTTDGFVHFKYHFSYPDSSPIADRIKIEGRTKKRTIINSTYPNRIAKNIIYEWKTNEALLKRYSSKFKKLTTDKRIKLLQEMDYNDELAKSIHQNPEKNIERYLNSHNPVNKHLLDNINGRYPVNGRIYAGNIYYFDPLYNPSLAAKLKIEGNVGLKGHGSRKVDLDILKELDELYPNGVKWNERGYPDFSSLKDKNGNQLVTIDVVKLTGDSKKDIANANSLYLKNGGINETGYTWHHIEYTTKLVRVPSILHDIIPHSGGMATHRASTK
ncbi:HNH endonuclease [Riemerella anatipestifer]|uniref:HNH endonuclease signature motif containing protein n=1 Tax=Riemerella anatipestifer TaxID=34085 RepID=UPI00129DA714|nr:HNH endonuclease [Riemerella anatipestifer]MRM83899.1 HNH endonuclease [Riemerella anatipestifer]